MGAAAGFFGGLLGGIGAGLVERRRRQDEMRATALQGSLTALANIEKSPNFNPEWIPDLTSASMASIANYTGTGDKVAGKPGGKANKNASPLAPVQQLIGSVAQGYYNKQPQKAQAEQGSAAANAAAPKQSKGPLFTTPEQRQEAQLRMDTAAQREKDKIAEEHQKRILEQKNRIDNQNNYELGARVADSEGLVGDPWLKRVNEYMAGIKEPIAPKTPVESSSEKLGEYVNAKGESMLLFRDPHTGKVYDEGHQPVDMLALKLKGFKPKEKEAGESGAELKQRESALRDLHPDWSTAKVKEEAAKSTLKHLDAVSAGATNRLVIEGLNVQDKREQVAAAPEIAAGIADGSLPPDRAGLTRNAAWMKIEAQLKKQGFNLAKAELDWKAAQRYVSTLNSAQQVRIREAASTVQQMLPDIRKKYDTWKKAELVNGVKILNKAQLIAAKNLPGEAGMAAQQLETQIADMTAELGQLYMGGNSPTDHALKLAETNLKGDWNEQQFKGALDLLKQNLGYRVNSIMNAGVAGMSENSPYTPQGGQGVADPDKPAPAPTRTATGPNGEKLGLVNGKWVPMK